ncbi:hypothetical protein [Enterococcus sp. BWR-S5]|uniref:hypothetical protein n=1 Tax=Enterococcus sp. BWR-S5 TaxID=2787714 RepID=UPI00192512E2|nr:hypothetical protein [Enterococcus sp. BWR-S5]MBL1226308.1 hypothetical protein [Enterococcus sp. BWR-S5]
MKKLSLLVVFLGVLGFFTIGSEAEATTDVVAENSMTSIMPFASPRIETITLKNGESYRIETTVIGLGGYCNTRLRVKTVSGDREVFALKVNDSEYTWVANASEYIIQDGVTNPKYGEVAKQSFTITNYSAGSVEYKIGVKVGYGATPIEAGTDAGNFEL